MSGANAIIFEKQQQHQNELAGASNRNTQHDFVASLKRNPQDTNASTKAREWEIPSGYRYHDMGVPSQTRYAVEQSEWVIRLTTINQLLMMLCLQVVGCKDSVIPRDSRRIVVSPAPPWHQTENGVGDQREPDSVSPNVLELAAKALNVFDQIILYHQQYDTPDG